MTAFANPMADPNSDDASMVVPSTRQSMTQLLLMFTTGRPYPLDSPEAAKAIDEFKRLAQWPPDNRETQIKRGELAKVDSCSSPVRTPLGTCIIESAATGAMPAKADLGAKAHYSVAPTSGLVLRIGLYHFDVATTSDSDSGTKACLALDGKWAAPSRSDRDAASERARQHAEQLR